MSLCVYVLLDVCISVCGSSFMQVVVLYFVFSFFINVDRSFLPYFFSSLFINLLI